VQVRRRVDEAPLATAAAGDPTADVAGGDEEQRAGARHRGDVRDDPVGVLEMLDDVEHDGGIDRRAEAGRSGGDEFVRAHVEAEILAGVRGGGGADLEADDVEMARARSRKKP
jgi:hypothetical protein